MSDLNLNITAEEQELLEMKLANILGGSLINSYGSVSTELVSVLLTAQQKPQNIEAMLASQEVYGNAVRKLLGVDPTDVDIEKVKVYKNMKEIVDQFEQQMAAQAEQQEQIEVDEVPEEVVEDVATVEEIEAGVEKVAEATAIAEKAVAEAQNVTQIPKTKSTKKAPAKKTTKVTSLKNN